MHRLEVGWLHKDIGHKDYTQVRAAEGGGTRHLVVHKKGKQYCRVVLDVEERTRIICSLHAYPIGGSQYGHCTLGGCCLR